MKKAKRFGGNEGVGRDVIPVRGILDEFFDGFFEGCLPGEIWIDGGVEHFLDEEERLELARVVEKGDIQLFGNVRSPLCSILPLALIDFKYCESGGTGVLLYDEVSWRDACLTLSMYAGVRGIGGGIQRSRIVAQCEALSNLPAPGRNKP